MQSNRTARRRLPTGIEVRHARTCPAAASAESKCNCEPSYRAFAWSKRDGKKLRKTFKTLSEAKLWRADATSQLNRGVMRAPTQVTLRQAAEAWLEGAADGTIRARGGRPYKPSAIRGYRAALSSRILPEFGGARLTDIRRVDLQDFVDRLVREGLDPSTIRNTLMPLRTIFRRALSRGDVSLNPTTGLELPAVTGKRDRIADPSEAAALIAALPETDRALWATAVYAGLRRGELQALRWDDVDLANGRIRVLRAYDDKAAQFIDPKSDAGRRTVPIPLILRDHLAEHRMRAAPPDGLLFGCGAKPFVPSNLARRALTAWSKLSEERATKAQRPIDAISLHECRTHMRRS